MTTRLRASIVGAGHFGRFHAFRAAAVPLILLILLPLLANWQAVSGWLQHDPIYIQSALARDVVPGPLQGLTSQDGNDGVTTEALGHLAAEQWLHGRVPWWNPYSGPGLPLAAEMQCSALFLPFVLLLHFADGPLLLKLAMQVVAGLATYGLLRALRMSRLAAFTGGALYELNGTFAWYGHAPMLPIAFLPLLLLGLERAARAAREGRRGGWFWVPVALAYSLYAGFPETAYIDGLLALAWAALRLGQMRGAARAAFAAKVVASGVAGLLLAAPAVLPFLQLLQQGDVGNGHVFARFSLSAHILVTLLLPYALGVQDTTMFDAADPVSWIHSSPGGYLSVAVLLLALLGALGRGRERGLRWLLLAWCVLAVGRMIGVPGIRQLVNAVPLLSQTVFYRYSPPSLELAAALFVAFALDDWRRGDVSRRAVLLASGTTFAALAAAFLAAWPLIASLLAHAPHYAWWFYGSLLWGGIAVAAGLLLLGAPSQGRRLALAALLTVDMLALFTVPGFSAPRHAEIDRGPFRFLAQNLGLHRFHSIGPLVPNYGAYFGLASINANYLPLPQRWTDHVTQTLDPYAGPQSFGGGAYPPWLSDKPNPGAVLLARLGAYEELGTRYVLAWHGDGNPFVTTAVSDVAGSADRAHPLFAGQALSGVFPAQQVKAGRVASFGVAIGTYRGAADGHLKVEVCADLACREGTADLAGAVDGSSLAIPLDAPLEVAPGVALRYRIVHADGGSPVALWMWPEPGARPGTSLVPRITLSYAGPVPPPRVYADDLVDIYELPDPKPYFEVRGGDCALTPAGREKVAAECRTPATLVRRELAYPGWHATVNGITVPVEEVAPLLQAVRLPAGMSAVRFRYWPPYIGWAYAAFLLGLAGLLAGAARALVR